VLEEDDSEECERKFRSVGEKFKLRIRLPDRKDYTACLAELPPLELGDVFVYLLSVCQWSPTRLQRRKEDDGYKLFLAGHNDKVCMVKVSN
jgi:hypothetical protein